MSGLILQYGRFVDADSRAGSLMGVVVREEERGRGVGHDGLGGGKGKHRDGGWDRWNLPDCSI